MIHIQIDYDFGSAARARLFLTRRALPAKGGGLTFTQRALGARPEPAGQPAARSRRSGEIRSRSFLCISSIERRRSCTLGAPQEAGGPKLAKRLQAIDSTKFERD
jgi:hypothetical protein